MEKRDPSKQLADGTPIQQISLRLPVELAERMSTLGEYHGRSRHAELVFALAIHDAAATLDALQDPATVADLGEAEHAAAVERVKADLSSLMAEAFRRPGAPVAHLTPEGGDPELN